MTEQRRARRTVSIFVGVSCAIHAVVLLCVPVGELGEPIGKRMLKEFRAQGIKFVKVIKPKPEPKPEPEQVAAPKPKPQPQRARVVRRPRVRRARRPRPAQPAPQPAQAKPEEPAPLEARVVPPPKAEKTEAPAPRPVDEPPPASRPEPEEIVKAAPEPEEVVPAPAPAPELPKPTIDTSTMVAMAPRPVAEGPKTPPISLAGPREPGRKIDSTEQPKQPSAPDLGNPEVSRPAPASGGDEKLKPQIGLKLGTEDRSALPGTEHRLGAPEHIAGPGGPRPVKVNPNPGGSSGGGPRVAKLPGQPTGPVVRSGVRHGSVDALGAPAGSPRAPGAPGEKQSPGREGPLSGPTMGTGPGEKPSPGAGDHPGPAAPGSPVALMTSPRGAFTVPDLGAGGQDEAGTGGGGGGEIVFVGGGIEGLLPAGSGGGGGSAGGGGSGAGKASPRLGSPWGGPAGEALYARGGPGGEGPGGSGTGGGGGGEGTGVGEGVGPGSGRGIGTGVGDGVGPGSGPGEPIVVAMVGPGGGYGYGDTGLPLGFPDGTTTEGLPGFPWLEPGLGKAGGGGEGGFGGPHGRGSGGGYPGRGDKRSPGFGGIPGGTGFDIPPPHMAGGGGGGEGGDQPGGPGIYGPLQVGGGGPGGPGGPGGLLGSVGKPLGIPLLPAGITRPLLGMAGIGGGPGGEGVGGGRELKAAPGGIYADLVGTFDIPVGVTNSDYNTDEVSVLNLLGVMRDRTNVKVKITNRYVPLNYEDVKDAPLLWISGHKAFTWTPEEREALRKYVENGGTILAEDCHGPFNQVFPDEMRRIFGDELEPIPQDDELFRSFYVIDQLPAGDVQERFPVRGIRTKSGRWGVIYSKNDYSDAWKVPRGSYVPDPTKEQAYRVGINMYVYILANWRRGQAQQAAATPGGPE
jgi:hypothetical protein